MNLIFENHPAAPAALDPDVPHHASSGVLGARQLNRIPATKVIETTARLPEGPRRALRWLHGHYWDSGEPLGEIARRVGCDGGMLAQVFYGKFEGELDGVVRAILRYQHLCEERAGVQRAPFIETRLYREIEECCDAALTYQKIVYIYGESQVGKTASLRHYAQNRPQAVMVEMPAGGSPSAFLMALAPKARVGFNGNTGEQMLTIKRALGPHSLLIVDEAARAFQARSSGGQKFKTLEFIREIHDATGCGVVLCGTRVFRESMESAQHRKFLNQFNRRCLFRKQLPDVPTRGDLNAFARHYGLEPAEGEARRMQGVIVGDHGLGVWLTTLMAAARKAANARRAMTWADVLRAHAFFTRLEQTPADEADAA